MTKYDKKLLLHCLEWDKDELVNCILELNNFIKEQKKEIKKLKNK